MVGIVTFAIVRMDRMCIVSRHAGAGRELRQEVGARRPARERQSFEHVFEQRPGGACSALGTDLFVIEQCDDRRSTPCTS